MRGCSTPPSPPSHVSNPPARATADRASAAVSRPSSETQLSATLTDARTIDLSWTNPRTEECAWFVEFNLGAETEFSILTIVPPQTTSFRHSELATDTKFTYRVLPAIGRASNLVSITTAATAPSNVAPEFEAEGPLNEPPPASPATASLRTSVPAHAVPGQLTATLSSPTSVDLRWRDRASDEVGYLVEVSLRPNQDFAVCALLPPDTTSFRKARLPLATTCYFRVRPFAHAAPSNTATATTPKAE